MDRREGRRRALGDRVRAERRDRGLSQERLADAAQLDRSHLAHVEAGDVNVSLDTLWAIADGLGVPVAALFAQPPPESLDSGAHESSSGSSG